MMELYNELFQRWVRTFDEFESLGMHRRLVRTTKYAASSCYEVKEYSPTTFRAGGILYEEVPQDALYPRKYGFDEAGRPIYVAYAHEHNGFHWEGIYNYSESRVEYVEFCLETGIPNSLEGMQIAEGRKTVYQHFHLNGGGTYLPDGDRQALIHRAENDAYLILCHIERFIYERGRIVGSDVFSRAPGLGRSEYKQTYMYNAIGELDEIRDLYDNGQQHVSYVRVREETNIDSLVNDLARQMADAVVEALLKEKIEQPLASLELFYKSVSNYVPLLRPRSLADWEDLIAAYGEELNFELLFLPSGAEDTVKMRQGPWARPLQELMQIMEQEEDYSIGRKMIRKSAFLLTRGKLNGKIAVSGDFVAYAIDWESDGHEFGEVLRACGQSEEVISDWKKRGWL